MNMFGKITMGVSLKTTTLRGFKEKLWYFVF